MTNLVILVGRTEMSQLLFPVQLFCILLTRTINKHAEGSVGCVQPECAVPLGTYNFRNFQPEFSLVEWKAPFDSEYDHHSAVEVVETSVTANNSYSGLRSPARSYLGYLRVTLVFKPFTVLLFIIVKETHPLILNVVYVFFQRGETALHIACRRRHITIVRLLLRNGAAVDAKTQVEINNLLVMV